LQRFEQRGQQSELLEVLAAAVRHGQPLAIHLQWGDQVVTLTIFPAQKLAHCALPMHRFMASRLSDLQVLQVERALRTPGEGPQGLVGRSRAIRAAGPLLWELAMRGSARRTAARDRRPGGLPHHPGRDLRRLELTGSLAAAVTGCAADQQPARDRRVAGLRPRAGHALLNALYLQAGLIVSRTHPAATNDRVAQQYRRDARWAVQRSARAQRFPAFQGRQQFFDRCGVARLQLGHALRLLDVERAAGQRSAIAFCSASSASMRAGRPSSSRCSL
jgi:hypothetical protein